MGADRAAASASGSIVRVAGCTCALLLVVTALSRYHTKPLYWFEAHHINFLLSGSSTVFLASTLILLWRLVQQENGSVGISLHAQRMNLCACLLRALFSCGQGGVSALTWANASLSVLGSAALVAVLEPRVAPLLPKPGGGRFPGAAPESFPSGALFLCIVIAAVFGAWFYSTKDSSDTGRFFLLATAIWMQTGAMLPQRAMFLRTKRLPALTSLAFFLLALAGAMRLLMWLVLVAEGEMHIFIMVGDFLHIALLADFVALYLRTLGEKGLGGLLDGGGVDLSLAESV